jgi:predicted outer membrane repeat protein
MDILESYSAAPQNGTGPTDDVVDQIYANLEAICELLQPEGAYCVLGKSIGALTQLHPLDEGIPDGSIDFAALNYVDRGYVLLGEAIEERYQPGWVSFRVPKDFDLWGHGDLFGYVHLTQAGYSIMSDRLEAKLDDLIRDAMLCESVVCDDGNECTNDVCDPPTGMCDYPPVADGTACDESNECTVGQCASGACDSTPIADGTACGGDAGTCQQGSCRVACTEQGIRDAIAAGGGPYTFDCGGPTTVETQAEIEIDNDVILDGAGNPSIEGRNTHRVFSVAAGVTAELRGLTIARGATQERGGGIKNEGVLRLTDSTVSDNTARYGGGINNEGVLTLTHSTVSDNTAEFGGGIGGIGTHGILTLINSTVANNTANPDDGQGGGIHSGGTATLTDSTVSGNTALHGGGILTGGTMTLTNSTISGNTAGWGGGGGITNGGVPGILVLVNSTVSGNTSGYAGGGINNGNTVTLMNSTVSDNTAEVGGGIANGGEMALINSTVAGNSAVESGSAIDNSENTLVRGTLIEGDCAAVAIIRSEGANLESPGDTCGFDQATDQVEVTAEQLNLGPLQDNGGPTQTHALGEGSAAIDQIPPEACLDAEGALLMTDQRGLPRPAAIVGPEPMCDVGAVEVQP